MTTIRGQLQRKLTEKTSIPFQPQQRTKNILLDEWSKIRKGWVQTMGSVILKPHLLMMTLVIVRMLPKRRV